ncbi:MAG: SufD family Fe-S cluster assembly protein, partial [Gammaproteobacteria bacterium]
GAARVGAGQSGPGADLELPIVIEHRAPDTTSEQRFHAIGAGKGRSIFNGRIHIHAGAERSDAWLSNRNLALDPAAEINTKPELEIYADDVRCAHGATVGQLDANAAFLLAARGIPPDAARNMLASAFLRAAMGGPLVDDPVFALTQALPDAAGLVPA